MGGRYLVSIFIWFSVLERDSTVLERDWNPGGAEDVWITIISSDTIFLRHWYPRKDGILEWWSKRTQSLRYQTTKILRKKTRQKCWNSNSHQKGDLCDSESMTRSQLDFQNVSEQHSLETKILSHVSCEGSQTMHLSLCPNYMRISGAFKLLICSLTITLTPSSPGWTPLKISPSSSSLGPWTHSSSPRSMLEITTGLGVWIPV